MSGDISFSSIAISKLLLHAARYPQLAVNGILLGETRGKDSDEIVLSDAVPLFHHQLGLAPMLEIALTQIEQHYKSDGLAIIGYYQANQHLKDNVPDFIAMKIAEKIAENNNDACLVMIDNKKLCLELESSPFLVYHLTSDGKWRNKEKSSIQIEEGSLEMTSKLLQRKIQHEICDFDNHLDNPTFDWSNMNINKLMAMTTDGV